MIDHEKLIRPRPGGGCAGMAGVAVGCRPQVRVASDVSRMVFALTVLMLAACDGPAEPDSRCNAGPLPLSGAAAAPTIVAVALEVQSSGIVVLATATDPQGSDNLLGVTQTIGVFQDRLCRTAPLVLRDDLAGSGLEESFGTVVPAANPLYSTIAAADSWPVEVDFRDIDGNRTTGRVMAPVF